MSQPRIGDTRAIGGEQFVVATVDPILTPGSSKRGTTTNVRVVGYSVGLRRIGRATCPCGCECVTNASPSV
ncbi:MAG: hypothetical protein IT379_23680 [Deltaproteobacteria bacterium]|nr:hypothetical protein [Deltaproteobacteria bacterium]